jgi:hypothetical protein
MKVPLGVQVFIFETESAPLAGGSPQVLAGKARKRKRPEISLRALFVNWIGAFSSLPFGKLPKRNSVRSLSPESPDSALTVAGRFCHGY